MKLSPTQKEGIRLAEAVDRPYTLVIACWALAYVYGACCMGEACLLAHQFEKAIAIGDQALRLSRERGERGYEAWALRFLGEVVSHHDPLELMTAEGHYRQALALADELSMRPLVAHCHFGLASFTAEQETGKTREYLITSAGMYREMDMGFWLAHTEAEMGSLSVRCTWENEAYPYKGDSLDRVACAAEREGWKCHRKHDSLRQVVCI